VTVRREIEIIPAQAILKERAIHAYACPNAKCEEAAGGVTVVKAKAPKPLISGSLASPPLTGSNYPKNSRRIFRKRSKPAALSFGGGFQPKNERAKGFATRRTG
jgi:hypothetical protein